MTLSLSASALYELERLWTQTAERQEKIAARLNAAFGTALTGIQVRDYAHGRGMLRGTSNKPTAIDERLRESAVMRWRWVVTPDNPVRRVPRGNFPASGFSMIGGRTR